MEIISFVLLASVLLKKLNSIIFLKIPPQFLPKLPPQKRATNKSGVCFTFVEVREQKKIDETYDLRTEIGKGNFAVVYMGVKRESDDNTNYAIKVIDKSKFEKFSKDFIGFWYEGLR